MRAFVVFTILAVGALALPDAADAQRRTTHKIDSLRIDAHLDLGWYGAFGLGARVDIPVVPDGVLSSGIDEMAISVGGDLLFIQYYDHRHGDDLTLLANGLWQWNFYVSDDWSIFPEVGLGVWFGNHGHHHHRHDRFRQDHDHVFFDFVAGFGARWHFGGDTALLMRITWPVGFQIGFTFDV